MTTQGIRAVIRSGESAKIEGAPEAEYHIYVDSVNGDDSNEGFGTDDPTDAANWAKAVQTGDRARLLVPRAGTTYIVCRGSITLSGAFPYNGYVGAGCFVIGYDEFTEIATGTVATYTAAPAKIPGFSEFTSAWGITDEDFREAFVEIALNTGQTGIFKAIRYNPNDGSYQIAGFSLAYVDVGAALRLVRPTTAITCADDVKLLRTVLCGVAVQTGANTIAVAEKSSFDACGFVCSTIDSTATIPLSMTGSMDGVALGAYGAAGDLAFALMPHAWTAPFSLYPGIYLYSSKGSSSTRVAWGPGGQATVYSSVIDGVWVQIDNRIQVSYSRFPDWGYNELYLYENALLNAVTCYLGRVRQDSGATLFLNDDCALSAGAYSNDADRPCWEADAGSSARGSHGAVVALQGNTADKIGVFLRGAGTEDIKITEGFDLTTPGTPQPIIQVDGGVHRALEIDLSAMDRGVGPLAVIKGNASVDLEKAVGTNNNAGNGYGLFVNEKAFVRADKTDCTMSGTLGELKVGKKDPQVFPAAGTRIEDVEIGTGQITIGNTTVAVTFATQFEAGETPKVELQPLGDAGGAIWPTAITNTGFTANITGALGVNLDFEYRARPQEPSRSMVEGY